MGSWWLTSFSIGIFGWGEFAARFWSALAGLGMALAAALSARRTRGAWLSAAVCASMTMGFAVSQLASSHALYACCTALAMAGFIRVARYGRRWAILAHGASLAAFVVHGPEGIILPWLTLLLFSHMTERFDVLRTCLSWAPAAAVSLAGLASYLALLWTKAPLVLYLMGWEAPQFIPPTRPPGLKG